MERNFDKNQQMVLFGKNKNKKERKMQEKKCTKGPPFFILPILDEKLFSIYLCVKLQCYPHFKILIIKYMDKIVIV